MRTRDRRGPLSALVLLAGYAMLGLTVLGWVVSGAVAGAQATPLQPLSPLVAALLAINVAFFAWRAAWRFAFTARSHGVGEGIAAVVRIPVTNVITIMAGSRAMRDYARTLGGRPAIWDKTAHQRHPARERAAPAMAGERPAGRYARLDPDRPAGSVQDPGEALPGTR